MNGWIGHQGNICFFLDISQSKMDDLFGELTTEEQQQIDELNRQRKNKQQQHLEKDNSNSLAYQRQRYLQNNQVLDANLRNHEPFNFGQMFTQSERQKILKNIHEYTTNQGWTTQRHGAFPTRDIPVKCLQVSDLVFARLEQRLFPQLEAYTGISAEYWAFRDLFVVGYHEDHQRKLDVHSDGCLASLTLLLNEASEFTGGGTYFEKFDMTVKQMSGDAWIHDGKLRHGGVAISSGKRIVMVAFMDTLGGYTDILTKERGL